MLCVITSGGVSLLHLRVLLQASLHMGFESMTLPSVVIVNAFSSSFKSNVKRNYKHIREISTSVDGFV